jgi:hypothetical protein
MFRRLLVLVVLCALAPASVLAASSGSWSLVAKMHDTRERFAVANSGGQMYVMGGFHYDGLGSAIALSSTERFNPATKTWSALGSLPAPRSGNCGAANVARIFSFGGTADWQPTTDTFALDPATQTWYSTYPMPGPVLDGACSRDAGREIFVFDTATKGGHVYELGVYRSLWKTMASTVPTLRIGGSAVLGPDGNIYLLGGGPAVVDVYHPGLDTWSTAASMPIDATGGEAALGADGRLYTGGGHPTMAAAYSFATKTWSAITPTPHGDGQLSRAGGTITSGGKLYYVGGFQSATALSSAETYLFKP